MEEKEIIVNKDAEGNRLDSYIAGLDLELSRTRVKKLIEDGKVLVNNKSEILKGCLLSIEPIKAITYCTDCKKEYHTVEFGKTCPYCGSTNTYLKEGNEFIIKDVTVD